MSTPNEHDINAIVDEWKDVDCIISQTKIGDEVVRAAKLHGKYLEYYAHFKRRLAVAEKSKSKLAGVKRRYYRGEMTREELTKFGWDQWNHIKPSATEMQRLLEQDPDMAELYFRCSELQTAVSAIEYILAQIKGRDFTIKTNFEYMRFMAGG